MPFYGDGETVQVRTLAKRAGKPVDEVRRQLQSAGVKTINGKAMYATSKIDLTEAMNAMSQEFPATESPAAAPEPEKGPAPQGAGSQGPLAQRPEPDLSGLNRAAEQASAKLPSPRPSGNEDDDPIPEAAFSETEIDGKGFPKVTNPDDDKRYWWINENPRRENVMRLRHWRFVTNREHIKRIRPDGAFLRMIDATGRVRHFDTHLACLPKVIDERRKAIRAQELARIRVDAEESVRANLEEANRKLRERLGRDVAHKDQVTYLEMDPEEALDRKEHAAKRRRGEETSNPTVFMPKEVKE